MKKTIKTITGTAALFILAGCSVGHLTSQKPVFEGHTLKDPDAFTLCLTPKWTEFNHGTRRNPIENGYDVIASDSDFGAMALTRVTKSADGGSQVTTWAQVRGYGNYWEIPVHQCMN